MKSRYLSLTVLAALALALPATASAAGRARDLRCTDSFEGGTYQNVTVPSGEYCSLTDVTVLGNVNVQAEAGLDLNHAYADGPLAQSPMTVRGNLTVAGTDAYADVNAGAIVAGTTTLLNADDVYIYGATVHNLVSHNSLDVYVASSDVYGSVLVNQPQSSGNIGQNEFITGSVAINGAAADAWYVEDQPIGGSVLLTNNHAPITVDANTIRHDLACYGNAPAPDTFDNQVGGHAVGQCAQPGEPSAL
jgi:hypothetical protein